MAEAVFPPYKRVTIADLIPYARNSRTHSEEQVAKIAASIREFGFLNPVITDGDNGIVAGHGRVLAAQKLGMAELPTIEAKHLSEAQKRAYIIADNRMALDAGWDTDLLRVEIADLEGEGFDLSLTGFDVDEIEGFLTDLTADGLTDPDDVPDLPDDPISVPGDVWFLGGHRLVCGDSTNADDVAKALNGVEPHLMVTDPPYGVEYSAGWRNDAMPTKNDPSRWRDGSGRATGKVENDDRADWSEVYALFPGDVAYVWHAGNKANIVAENLVGCGLLIRSQIIWVKNQLVIGRGDYHPQHEPCWYAVRKNRKGHYCGGRKQTTVWNIDRPRKSETGHSTQKPIECMKRPIENNSSPGQAVYDPFLGSGTTLIAAEMTGRKCHGLELSPAYCDVIVKRWQDFTGKDAVHETSGKTYTELRDGTPTPQPD